MTKSSRLFDMPLLRREFDPVGDADQAPRARGTCLAGWLKCDTILQLEQYKNGLSNSPPAAFPAADLFQR